MNRSAVIVLVCILAIAGSIVWWVVRPKSPAATARAQAERRQCFACGYEWRKDRGALIRESKNAPPGYQFVVQCPKCHEWAGMSVVHCEHCGKDFTAHTIVENEDGPPSFPKQRVCPYCHTPLGGPVEETPSPPE